MSGPRGIPFIKVEGAGNDFVLIDARAGCPRAAAEPLRRVAIRGVLDRRRGVGGDGLLRIEDGVSRPRVRFWNPDGGRAAFCGNGARCVAALLLGAGPAAEVSFDFGRDTYRARRTGRGRYAVRVPLPAILPPPSPLPPDLVPNRSVERAVWIDSGVPHWVVPVGDIDRVDLAAAAPAVRSARGFGREGTNVDAVETRGEVVHVRTYERGVEGETLSCGSGLVAAGFWAGTLRGQGYPLRLRSRGGDRFAIETDPDGLWLEGPARVVFSGVLGVS